MSRSPQEFFREHVLRTGHEPLDGPIAVGMVFLPRTDLEAQERCRCIVETEVLKLDYYIYGWRQVPIDVEVIGEKANAARPEIEQIMIANTRGVSEDEFERDLYVIRRRIEKATKAEGASEFYICSLSCRSIIYKGMFLAEQLTAVLSGPSGRPVRVQLRDLPPALLDQHLPDVAAGAAVPNAGPQRRDQHRQGQRQLDARA